MDGSKLCWRSTFGAGSSPGLSQIFLRTAVIAPTLFHSIPESSSEMRTSGRPSVCSNAVFTELPAVTHEPVPAGKLALASTRLMPRIPHSSSLFPLTPTVWTMRPVSTSTSRASTRRVGPSSKNEPRTISCAPSNFPTRAAVAESPGVYRPSWSIEDVRDNLNDIRDTNAPLIFPVVPDGHAEHLRYSFARVEREGAGDGQRR